MEQYYPEGWSSEWEEDPAVRGEPDALREAWETGRILQARVKRCDAAHELTVDLGGVIGRIPKEEGAVGVREGTVRDIALISRVNKPVSFIVTGLHIGENGKTEAILSRRSAQMRCEKDYLNTLKPGDVIPARVTHLEPFGAFCDIGCGVVSLLPIDMISVSRIFHPADRFRPGDRIWVAIKGRDEQGRLTLTHKELLGTWAENAAAFEPGETVPGIVRSVEPYGSFIELAPNLAGLAEPRDGVREGMLTSVYIKSILPDKMKIKLIVIDAFEGDYPQEAPHYYGLCAHIDRWRYSPTCCPRVIETVFEPDGGFSSDCD